MSASKGNSPASKPVLGAAVFFLLAFQLAVNFLSVQKLSITTDENLHLRYGMQMLTLNSDRFDYSKMPFSVFNAAAAAVSNDRLNYKNIETPVFRQQDLNAARYPTMIFSLILGLLVFCWSRDLYGPRGGLLSLVLYVFCPNMLAHSQLVTVDLYCALGITASLYTFWKFINQGGAGRGMAAAFTLGAAQLTKYTCVYLYPYFLLILAGREAVSFFQNSGVWFKERKKKIGPLFGWTLVFIFASILILNAGYLFNRTMMPLGEYNFKSSLFQSLEKIPGLAPLPVPVPYPFLQGLDELKLNENNGTLFWNTYLNGKLHTVTGEPGSKKIDGYYFAALLYKTPLTSLILFFSSIVLVWRDRKKRSFWDREWFIFLPLIFFMIYINYFFAMPIGLRYASPVFPLMYVLCGRAAENLKPGKWKAVIAALLVWLVVSVLSYFPHYIPYFNELIGDRKNAYKYLADSNTEWGQARIYLNEYLQTHPGMIVAPSMPVSGKIIVSASSLVGIYDPEKYRWLRENFKPVGHVAYAYLIFEVTPGDLAKLQSKQKAV